MASRITAEEVVEAYKITGLKPIRNKYLDGGCGCAIGALCYKKDPKFDDITAADELILDRGLSPSYEEGFYCGFDGLSKGDDWANFVENPSEEDYNNGFADGFACAKAVGL